jgi:hypothetical protein
LMMIPSWLHVSHLLRWEMKVGLGSSLVCHHDRVEALVTTNLTVDVTLGVSWCHQVRPLLHKKKIKRRSDLINFNLLYFFPQKIKEG